MVLDNDSRGWIMTCVSGVACILGAGIIYVDCVVRLFPRMKHFRIQDSHAFLSASLSLSFGVMLFSSLYSILPASKRYFEKAGYSPEAAAWTLIGCFLGGAIGIQLLSRCMHHFIPSQVVDCDHTHEQDDGDATSLQDCDDHQQDQGAADQSSRQSHLHGPDHAPLSSSESTPLLSSVDGASDSDAENADYNTNGTHRPGVNRAATQPRGRPSLKTQVSRRVSSLLSGTKAACDLRGPCYGLSDPCGHECFRHLHPKCHDPNVLPAHPTRQVVTRSTTTPFFQSGASVSLDGSDDGHSRREARLSVKPRSSEGGTRHFPPPKSPTLDHDVEAGQKPSATTPADPSHHHHVPKNAFLSIGLQTSIAIAIHKLPEGFITFATNHANPKLGFAVFMALAVHNVVEGFSMALPLYLALGSRLNAMFWSSLLGGVSQPLGGAVAAIWLRAADQGEVADGEDIYGGMFAVTAGIMTSVALQLFSESLSLNHNRTLCFGFAFLGMAILGITFALTAEE